MVQTRRQRIENGDECPPIDYFENKRYPHDIKRPICYELAKGALFVGVCFGFLFLLERLVETS